MTWTGTFVFHPARVLVVDDHQTICNGIAYELRKAGAEVLAHAKPDHVLKTVEQARPDCAIVDWKLPGWRRDGIAVIEEVKELSRDTPAILVSSYGREFRSQSPDRAAFEAFVDKSETEAIAKETIGLAQQRRTSLPWRALELLLANVEVEPHKLNEHVRSVIVQVCADMAKDWPVPELCLAAGRICGRYLNQLFVTDFRTTPADLVRRWRVKAAILYLQETDLGHDVIARNVGLGNERNMNRVFHRLEGCAPGAFRK